MMNHSKNKDKNLARQDIIPIGRKLIGGYDSSYGYPYYFVRISL